MKEIENLEKFTINSFLENENLESFNAFGNFEVINKETILDLKLKLDKFNLGILSSIGGDVMTNIRGLISGNAAIEGNLKKPKINGRLVCRSNRNDNSLFECRLCIE